MNKATDDETVPAVVVEHEPLAVTIGKAATICGLSLSTFRAQFLDTGLVQAIHVSRQSRIIDVQELRDAYRKYIERHRAEH